MIQVTQNQWDKLTQAEKTLAKSLGITPKKPAITKRESLPKPEPYIMQAKVHCYLCKSDTEQFFHMKLKESIHYLPYLQSVKVTEKEAQELKKGMPYHTKVMEMSTCSVCPEVLMKWEKKELVRKLIEVYPQARAALLGGSSLRNVKNDF